MISNKSSKCSSDLVNKSKIMGAKNVKDIGQLHEHPWGSAWQQLQSQNPQKTATSSKCSWRKRLQNIYLVTCTAVSLFLEFTLSQDVRSTMYSVHILDNEHTHFTVLITIHYLYICTVSLSSICPYSCPLSVPITAPISPYHCPLLSLSLSPITVPIFPITVPYKSLSLSPKSHYHCPLSVPITDS